MHDDAPRGMKIRRRRRARCCLDRLNGVRIRGIGIMKGHPKTAISGNLHTPPPTASFVAAPGTIRPMRPAALPVCASLLPKQTTLSAFVSPCRREWHFNLMIAIERPFLESTAMPPAHAAFLSGFGRWRDGGCNGRLTLYASDKSCRLRSADGADVH